MKAADIRAMNEEAREQALRDLYGEWRDLRFQEAVGQLTATGRIGQIRRDIARIKTIQGESERATAAASQA
jgi:large subunit ribosomal protein L29